MNQRIHIESAGKHLGVVYMPLSDCLSTIKEHGLCARVRGLDNGNTFAIDVTQTTKSKS